MALLLLELQRLVARGPGTLPDTVIVDVGAIARWQRDRASGGDAIHELTEAASCSHRSFIWVVAPTAIGAVDSAVLSALTAVLRTSVADQRRVIGASQPALALVRSGTATQQVAVVSADVEQWWCDLHVLETAQAVLDITSGISWTVPLVSEHFGAPRIIPELWFATDCEPGQRPLVKEASRHREAVRAALESGAQLGRAAVPERVQKALANAASDIDERASRMAAAASDARAVRDLRNALGAEPRWVNAHAPDHVHLVADVERAESGFKIRRLRGRIEQQCFATDSHAQAIRQLSELPGTVSCWYTAGGMDLLTAAAEAGVRLPERAVDTAILAMAANPDFPYDPGLVSPMGASLPTRSRNWMRDAKRVNEPADDIDSLLQVLPDVTRDLFEHVERAMVEDDLAHTLPVMASIEAHGGAWTSSPAGFSSFAEYRASLEQQVRDLMNEVGWVFGRGDPARVSSAAVLANFKRRGRRLPEEEFDRGLEPTQELERLKERGDVDVEAALSVRTILGSHLYWARVLEQRNRVRGRHFLQATGRFGTREFNLQGIPKREAAGKILRAGLEAPPGYVLVGADFNAFEARLLASLSNDPFLVSAAQQQDMHRAIADAIFSSRDDQHRSLAKAILYAIIYGQGRSQFWMSQPQFSKQLALEAFDRVERELQTAMSFRRHVLEQFRTNEYVATEGGWYRAPFRRTQAFNTTVQGLAADILRWVLRRLQAELKAVGGFVVHQAHDEVLAAVPPEHTRRASDIFRAVMDEGVLFESDLLPRAVPLFVETRTGKTWDTFI